MIHSRVSYGMRVYHIIIPAVLLLLYTQFQIAIFFTGDLLYKYILSQAGEGCQQVNFSGVYELNTVLD